MFWQRVRMVYFKRVVRHSQTLFVALNKGTGLSIDKLDEQASNDPKLILVG